MVRFQGVKKQLISKDKKLKLHIVDCEFEQGTCVSVIGDNGTGKTTLLRLVAGSLLQDSGRISILRPLIAFTDIERQMHYRLTVQENIRYFCALYGVRITSKSLSEIAAEVGIKNLINLKVSRLSKGQKKRLVLMLLKCGAWKTIVLDEPTLGLDSDGLQIFVDVMTQLKKSGASILISSHDVGTLSKISEHVLIVTRDGIVKPDTFNKLNPTILFDVHYQDGTSEIANYNKVKNLFEGSGKLFAQITYKGISLNDQGK